MNLMKFAIHQLSLHPNIKKSKDLHIYSDFRLLIMRYFEDIMYTKKDQKFSVMVNSVLAQIKKNGFCYVDFIRKKCKTKEFECNWERILENPSVSHYFK